MYVKKLMPVDVYDIAAAESYFKDMAQEGLFIKKIGIFACFEKGEPKKVTYRIEPMLKRQRRPDDEMLGFYKDAGWEYVFTIPDGFFVFISEDETPKELHTDPVIQSYTFKYLNRNLKLMFILWVLLFISVCFMIYAAFSSGHPALYFVEYGQTVYACLMVLYTVFTFYYIISRRVKLKRLTSSLGLGEKMPHKARYKYNYFSYAANALICFLSVYVLIMCYMYISLPWQANLKEYKNALPALRISDIEKGGVFYTDESYYDGMDYNNGISYKSTELAEIYTIRERLVSEDKMWLDGSGRYSPSIKTKIYDLKVPFFADSVFKELIDDELEFFKFESICYEELMDTPFDKAVLVKISETQMLFAVSGKKVIEVRYHGYEELKLYIDDIYESQNINFDLIQK